MGNIKNNQKACGYRLAIMELLNRETDLESYALFDTLRVLYSEYEKSITEGEPKITNSSGGCVAKIRSNDRENIIKWLKDRETAIQKIESFGDLKDNWNGYGAPEFSKELLNVARNAIFKLSYFPEIFPISGGAIQFEYEKPTGEYLEFEIYENGSVHAFLKTKRKTKEFDLNIDGMNKIVRKFLK